jgi:hypothetical protein
MDVIWPSAGAVTGWPLASAAFQKAVSAPCELTRLAGAERSLPNVVTAALAVPPHARTASSDARSRRKGYFRSYPRWSARATSG